MADGQILRKGDGGVHGTEALPQHLAGSLHRPHGLRLCGGRRGRLAFGRCSVSELALAGKAVIFVPSPNVAEDHQTKNARALADRGAALLIPDAEAVEKALPAALVLAGDLPRREELERNIRTMATPDAAQQVASEIIKLARRP